MDALLLGSGTYEVALSFGAWPSADRESWAFTQRIFPVAGSSVTLTSDDPARAVEALEERGLKPAWLMGGGKLVAVSQLARMAFLILNRITLALCASALRARREEPA